MDDSKRDLQEIGRGAYDVIAEMVADLAEECPQCEGGGQTLDAAGEPMGQNAECAYCDGTGERSDDDREAAREAIESDPLSIEVRSGWDGVGAPLAPEEYQILLATGGPAVRIVGQLDMHGEPESATLQAQDWFQPWTDYREADEDVLLAYVGCFYFSF